jgi:hypothetical protein
VPFRHVSSAFIDSAAGASTSKSLWRAGPWPSPCRLRFFRPGFRLLMAFSHLIAPSVEERQGRRYLFFSSSPLPYQSCHKAATVSSSGLIIISFFTCETPGAAHAAISACSRSAHELTVPRRRIFPFLASTEIVSASSSA